MTADGNGGVRYHHKRIPFSSPIARSSLVYEQISKYLELMKLTGWQSLMVSIGSAILIYLSKNEYIPPIPQWIELIIWGVLVFSAVWWIARIGPICQSLVESGWQNYQKRRAKAARKDAFINDIPHLTAHEKNILGYLLAKNQKRFTTESNGGYANTLIAKRYIVFIGFKGMQVSEQDVPCEVADFVWDVMQERSADFPYTPQFSQGHPRVETHPWRVPWMLR